MTFSGVTRRYVSKSPRVATELFVTEFEGTPLEPSLDHRGFSGVLVDEFQFGDASAAGPVAIYQRAWGPSKNAEALAQAVFAGNTLAADRPSGPAIIDVSDAALLRDEDFWPIIDILEGRMSLKAISRAAAELTKRTDDFIGSFAQTASRRMWELDVPEICDPAVARDGTPYLDGDRSRARRGAAIAAGSATFERARNDPETMRSLRLSDLSWGIELIPMHAWRSRHGDNQLVTAWSVRPGSNRERWALEPHSPRDSIEREDDEVGLPSSAVESVRSLDSPPHQVHGSWWTSRVLIDDSRSVTECVVLSVVRGTDDEWDSTERACQLIAKRLGGEVVGRIESQDLHSNSLSSGDLFHIKRRSALTLDTYIEHFVPGDTIRRRRS